jgi:fructose 1,6-bisphosphatase
MYFPHGLRDAIPEWEDSARMLRLTHIDGNCSHSQIRGRRIELNFHVEEAGKLQGAFNVYADLEIEAARALAATLMELVQRAEDLPPSKTPTW